MRPSLSDWRDQGSRVQLDIGGDVAVFRRLGGSSGEWWTMLHG